MGWDTANNLRLQPSLGCHLAFWRSSQCLCLEPWEAFSAIPPIVNPSWGSPAWALSAVTAAMLAVTLVSVGRKAGCCQRAMSKQTGARRTPALTSTHTHTENTETQSRARTSIYTKEAEALRQPHENIDTNTFTGASAKTRTYTHPRTRTCTIAS